MVYLPVFSQSRTITGVVKSKIDNETLPGAKVIVKGTEIKSETDFNGYFEIEIPYSLYVLEFYFIGLLPKEVQVDSEEHIEVFLEHHSNIKNRFIIIGGNLDVLNSLGGLSISNGFYEHSLIHFEDLDTDILYQLSGQTNFSNDYSFSGNLAWSYPVGRLHLISLDFEQKHFNPRDLFLRDIGLSGKYYLGFIDISLLTKGGHQKLNEQQSFGASLGVQKSHRGFYYGAVVGYYNDYLSYSAFLHTFLFKDRLGLRINYDKVSDYDFLNIGLNLIIINNR